MCNDRILNAGLPAAHAQFDRFDSDEDADGPIEDEEKKTPYVYTASKGL